MTAAQQEFNELIRDKDRDSRHPEDRRDDSDLDDLDDAGPDYYPEKPDTDDELDLPQDMRSSNYYLPSIRSDAQTGPKGVIADAHSYEQARKQARRFTWKKNSPPTTYHATAYHDEKAGSDVDSEDGFMQQWRENRLRELQTVGQRIRSRTTSPTGRTYGKLQTVDGAGYLEAIDPKNAGNTVVVVLIYDDRSDISGEVENIVAKLAKEHKTTRFVKLHCDDAGMELAGVPAVLAYKNDRMFANLTPLLNELPKDSHLTSVSVESVFLR
jgi:hypothetical protein